MTLKALRRHAGFETPQKLADRLLVSLSAVYRWERGVSTPPTAVEFYLRELVKARYIGELDHCCSGMPHLVRRQDPGRPVEYEIHCPNCGRGTGWIQTEGMAAIEWNKQVREGKKQ